MTVMGSEIREIPMRAAAQLQDAAGAIAAAEAIRVADPRWLSMLGRGTSDHAATYGRYLLEATLGRPVAMAAPSLTTVYAARQEWQGGVVMAVSQSGRGPDVVEVVEAARAGGALTIAITNDGASPLASAAHHLILCRSGDERAVAATKTYVAELVCLASLAAELRPRAPWTEALGRLPTVLDRCLERAIGWVASSGVVNALAVTDRCLAASRGYNLATALEVALKLKETSGIFAEGYSTADLMHGPVALAAPGIPLLAFRPDGPMGRRIDDGVGHAAAAGSPVWMVGGREVEPRASVDGAAALALPLDLPEELTPMALVLVGQLIAEAVAVRRGRDPDAPRGLRKVTMTR